MTDRLQRPLRDLRISVMDRCNFRCPYCMPEDKYHPDFEFLKSSERLSFEEILRLAHIFAGLGVCKLRITGGEPLLRPNIAELVGDLSRVPGIDDIALTTNGILLAQHAAALKAAGLSRVTVSLDSLDDAVFLQMSGGRGSKAQVLEGIHEAITAGLTPIKVNAVVKRGVNEHTVVDLVEHFRGTRRDRALHRVHGRGHHQPLAGQRHRAVPGTAGHAERPLAPHGGGGRTTTARLPSVTALTTAQGEVGFISSVSEPFCGSCTRGRLSSDGQLYTCLFASRGTDLKGPLRAGLDDDQLRALITGVWTRREDRYSELRAQKSGQREGGDVLHRRVGVACVGAPSGATPRSRLKALLRRSCIIRP